jgi:hypothetical protein
MIIKVNRRELEFFENSNIYLGSPKIGQIFKEIEELDENILNEMVNIQEKAEDLIKQAEHLLSE